MRKSAGHTQRHQRGIAQARFPRHQCRDDVCPEPLRFVVGLVEAQPGNRLPVTRAASPFGEQCGLAPPGWGNDNRQLLSAVSVQSLGQPLATHDSGMQERRGELGRKQLPDSVFTNIRN